MDPTIEFHASLVRWNRRLRLERALRFGWISLNTGLILGLATAVPGILRSSLVLSNYYTQAAWAAVLATFLGPLLAYLWPLPLGKTAILVDQRFRLKDRVSTAHELLSLDPGGINPMTLVQRGDARDHLNLIQPGKSHRPALSWRQLFTTIIYLTVLIAVPALLQDNFQHAAEYAAHTEAIQDETARLDSLLTRIETDESLTKKAREQLTAPIEDALSELRQANSLEQAVAALDQAVNSLEIMADQRQPLENINTLRDQLRSGDLTNLEPFLDALSARDFENAAEKLDDLAAQLESLTSPIVARELEQVAAAAGEFEPTLARKLDEAAMAILQGDQTAARSNLQKRLMWSAGPAGRILYRANPQRSQRKSQPARSASAQPVRPQGRLQVLGNYLEEVTVQDPSRMGRTKRRGLAKALAMAMGTRLLARPRDSGPPSNDAENQPGNGGLEAYERIYAPSNLGGEDGPQIVLPNSGPTGDVIQGQSSGSAPEPELSRVPYVDVFATYAAVYRQAIEAGQVPPHLRDIVRKYFTSLAPD